MTRIAIIVTGGQGRNYGNISKTKTKPGDRETGRPKIGDIVTGNNAERPRHDRPATDLVPFKTKQEKQWEVAEKDGELLNRANRFGPGYQPLEKRADEANNRARKLKKTNLKARAKPDNQMRQFPDSRTEGLQHRR